MKSLTLRKLIKEELEKYRKKIEEIKITSISVGDTFTLSDDLGKFKKGEEVEVIAKMLYGDDIKLIISNGKFKDTFYIDKNDDIEELNENAIATNYQFTPQQLNLIKKYGGKLNKNTETLYIPDTLKIQLDKHMSNSEFKKEFSDTLNPERKYLISQIMTAMKQTIEMGGSAKIDGQQYFIIKGHITKNNNFNFPNPSRIKSSLINK